MSKTCRFVLIILSGVLRNTTDHSAGKSETGYLLIVSCWNFKVISFQFSSSPEVQGIYKEKETKIERWSVFNPAGHTLSPPPPSAILVNLPTPLRIEAYWSNRFKFVWISYSRLIAFYCKIVWINFRSTVRGWNN